MPQAVGSSSSQEYWRSPHPEIMRLVSPMPAPSSCWHCGADYAPAARFCHICGSQRERQLAIAEQPDLATSEEATKLLDRLGLTATSLIFFLLGATCLLAAVLTGFLYKADTMIAWQAIQLWRIEWLLASAAAFLAGILLKRRR